MATEVCQDVPGGKLNDVTLGHACTRPVESSKNSKQAAIKVHVHTDPVKNQHGTWALVRIRSGDVVLNMARCPEISSPDRYTVQIADTVHLYQVPDISAANSGLSAAFVNHSCQPNTFIDTQNRAIVAISDIEAGDQITFNYLSSEDAMDSPFACLCGSQNCLADISGYKHLSPSDRNTVSHVAPWLLEKYATS